MSTAYGSITVSGLTDIADIYFEYALAVSDANVTNSYPFNQVGELGWTINGESRKVPPTWQAGYKVWVREVKVKTDITTKFYGEPYPDTAINQTSQDLIALQTKVKKIWSNSTGSYMASGIGLNDVDIADVSTYGFNSRSTTSGISLNYNNAKIVDLNSTPSLDFYQPPTINGTVVTPGNKTMSLSGQTLKFYSPSDGTTELATLNANGLLLKAGGLESGSFANNQNYIYVSTNNTASRTIGTGTNKTNWRIIAGNKFGVDSLGNLYATNANITGAIVATSGTIGGWNIGTDTNKSLYYDNQTPGATTTNLVLSPTSAVNTNSIANSPTNKTWFISAGQNFGVDTNGILYAKGANITGQITIEGHSDTLSDEISALQQSADGTLIYNHTYTFNEAKTTATFYAVVYRGGINVTDEFDDENFTWYYKTDANEEEQPILTNYDDNQQLCNWGKTITVDLSNFTYGGEVVGRFTTGSQQTLLSTNRDTLTDTNNRGLTATASESGTSIRVRDLETTTTLYDTDKVMIVGTSTEKIATLATLASFLGSGGGSGSSSLTMTINSSDSTQLDIVFTS